MFNDDDKMGKPDKTDDDEINYVITPEDDFEYFIDKLEKTGWSWISKNDAYKCKFYPFNSKKKTTKLSE